MAIPVGDIYGVGQRRFRRGLVKEANAPAIMAGLGALTGLGGMWRHQNMERAGEQILSDMGHLSPEARKERGIRRAAQMIAAAAGGAALGTGAGYLVRHIGDNIVGLAGDAGKAFGEGTEKVIKRNVDENLVPLKDEIIDEMKKNRLKLKQHMQDYGPKVDQASKALQDTVDTVRAPFVAAGKAKDFAKAQVNREVKIPGNSRVSEWANNTRFQDLPGLGWFPKVAGAAEFDALVGQVGAEKRASILLDGEQAAAQILRGL